MQNKFQTISIATLKKRFPTEEEQDLWWEHQRMRMSAMVSDTDEERSGYDERARLLWEDIVYIQFSRHCEEEEEKAKLKPKPKAKRKLIIMDCDCEVEHQGGGEN